MNPPSQSAWHATHVEDVLREFEAGPEGLSARDLVRLPLGGPAGILDAGGTARHLAHTAPVSVLTVPI